MSVDGIPLCNRSTSARNTAQHYLKNSIGFKIITVLKRIIMEFKAVDGELCGILSKYFSPVFQTGYVETRGCVLPENYKKFAERIENFNVRNDDLFVISFPKSGSTWTQEMVWLIGHDLDFEGAKSNLLRRFPILETSALFDLIAMQSKCPEIEGEPHLTDSVTYIDNMAPPRFIKTHLPWQLLPKQIRDGTKKPKIIYVTRNVKDTCVSFYHHNKLMGGYSGSFEDFCKLFLGGTLMCAPFWPHVLNFWKRHDEPNVLFLKYEDLKKDLPKEIKKIASFLGKDLHEDQIALLSEHLTFENMKNNPFVNLQSYIDILHKYKLTGAEGHFIRSGQVGNYKEIMSPQIIEKFDHWTQVNLEGTGLSFS